MSRTITASLLVLCILSACILSAAPAFATTLDLGSGSPHDMGSDSSPDTYADYGYEHEDHGHDEPDYGYYHAPDGGVEWEDHYHGEGYDDPDRFYCIEFDRDGHCERYEERDSEPESWELSEEMMGDDEGDDVSCSTISLVQSPAPTLPPLLLGALLCGVWRKRREIAS